MIGRGSNDADVCLMMHLSKLVTEWSLQFLPTVSALVNFRCSFQHSMQPASIRMKGNTTYKCERWSYGAKLTWLGDHQGLVKRSHEFYDASKTHQKPRWQEAYPNAKSLKNTSQPTKTAKMEHPQASDVVLSEVLVARKFDQRKSFFLSKSSFSLQRLWWSVPTNLAGTHWISKEM